MLEAEESLRSLAAALGERLIKDGYDKRACRNFEQTHQEHRKRRQRKRSPVRLYVSKESLKIAHQQFGNTLNEGSRVSSVEGSENGCKSKTKLYVPVRDCVKDEEFATVLR